MSALLRLVKVVVQPHFVLDDGEHLTEQVASPITVAAADWPTYSTEGFARALEQLQTTLCSASDAHPEP